MTVVRLFATLRDARGGGLVTLEREGGPLRALLVDLLAVRPDLRSRVLDERDHLVPYVNVFVDGRDCRYLDGIDTRVRPGQELYIFPPMAGGRV